MRQIRAGAGVFSVTGEAGSSIEVTLTGSAHADATADLSQAQDDLGFWNAGPAIGGVKVAEELHTAQDVADAAAAGHTMRLFLMV